MIPIDLSGNVALVTGATGELGRAMVRTLARGNADPDSDIDFLVLLEGPVDSHDDSWTCIRALYPLVLKSGRPIHAEPVTVSEYEAAEFPLYQNVKREGVAL